MITKIHAATLYGYNYQLVDNEGNVWDINSLTPYALKITRNERIPKTVEFEEIGSTYKILCRPISDLTKEIKGVGVPLIELAKIGCPDINFKNIRKEDGGFLDDGWVTTFYFENGSFYGAGLKKIHSQDKMLNWLHTNHFNIDFPSGTTQNLI